MTPGLETIISPERIGSYLTEANFDRERALRLYAWNLHIAAAFMPLLACAEVAGRNLIGARLVQVFGPTWWDHPGFHQLEGGRGKGIVLRAARAVRTRGLAPDHGRITAELSFGFWVNMMFPRYAEPLWTPLHQSFRDLPDTVGQSALFARLKSVQDLRNRISHHEPLIRRNISQDYATSLGLVRWLNRELADWIGPQCEVMRLMRTKP